MALEKRTQKLDAETLTRIREMRKDIAERLSPLTYAARQSTRLAAEDYRIRFVLCPPAYKVKI